MKQLQLNKGLVSFVDDEDFDELNKHRWYVSNKGYAQRSFNVDGTTNHVYLHRVLMGATEGVQVDHINGDKLDNRRENLRLCTPSENRCNSRYSRTPESGYRGVHSHGRGRGWVARAKKNGVNHVFGYFSDPKLAHEAYIAGVKALHGEFVPQALAALGEGGVHV